MYWQKRFDRVNPNQELEEKIIAIRKEHKDYGYRRIHAVLRKNSDFKLHRLHAKVVNTVRIKAMLAKWHQIEYTDDLIHLYHIKR